jgi:hypothetical protein
LDYYYDDDVEKNEKEFLETNILPLPSKKEQFVEAIVIMFPWLALLIPLYMFGISLWMAWILPADVIIAFALGTFIGMIISEGLFQVFQGIFSFYYFQGNIYEAKRTMKRYLAFTGLITFIIFLIFYSFSRVQNIPYELTIYTITGTFTICFFRIFYMTIYSLKKYRIIITSYTLSILTLLLVYFTLPDQMLPTFKYFTAFGIAFLLLFSISIYFNFTIFFKKFSFTLFLNRLFKIIYKRKSSKTVSKKEETFLINFYYPPSSNVIQGLKSIFKVQLWENLYYLFYGTLYFVMLFGDRLLSWIYNPVTIEASNGVILPMAFNTTYHIGADIALLIMTPAGIIQYIIVYPLYQILNNKSVYIKIREIKTIDQYLLKVYKKLILVSIVVSVGVYIIMNIFGPTIIDFLGGNEVSVQIFQIASIANVFFSIFIANSIFLAFLKDLKILLMMVILSSGILLSMGPVLALYGFQNIIWAYAISIIIPTILSTRFTLKILKNGSTKIFG